MSWPAWRSALRMARREAWAHKGRAVLVIALIGLPVFVLTGADIAYRTWQLSPAEKITRTIGAADAGIRWGGGGPVRQDQRAWLDGVSTGDPAGPRHPLTEARLRTVLPAGTRIIEQRWDPAGGVEIRTDAGLEYASLVGLDYADPIARGLVHQRAGRAPRTVHETALTAALARSAGLGIGDTLRLADRDQSLQIVGIVTDADDRGTRRAYVLPAAIGGDPARPDGTTFLVDTATPVTWTQVLALNQLGYAVLSRQTFLHPPPASQVPDLGYHPGADTEVLASGALVVGMALLEVVLLAGPAFAVGARRQRRDLALIAATGGRPRDLRNVVLAGGVVLGLAGGVLAVLAGLGTAAIGVPLLARHVASVPGHFDVRPLELGGLVLVSLVTALLAALFPARSATRTDVVAALSGRRDAVRDRKRVPILGVVATGIGAVVAIGGAATSSGTTAILAGVVLVELGLIACTPTLLGWLARVGRHLPLSGRIALRDAGRNRSAATPAVAAVMASVIGAVALAIGAASNTDRDRRDYRASLPTNDAWVSFDPTQVDDPGAIAAALRATLPTAGVAVVERAGSQCWTRDACVSTDVELARDATNRMTGANTRYRGGQLPPVIVDDGSDLDVLFGRAEPAAAAALRAGRVVVVDRAAIGPHGTVTLQATTWDAAKERAARRQGRDYQPSQRMLTVPAALVEDGYPAAQVILPPSVATELGAEVVPDGVFAHDRRMPTDAEQQAARAALAKLDPSSHLYVESGFHDPNAWLTLGLVGAAAVIAVAAAVIATALANVDGRADLITLGAVGASPRTRRLLSMWRAGVIAGIGAVIGVAAGFVPPIAWIHAQQPSPSVVGYGTAIIYGDNVPAALRLAVPWPAVAAALIGIPLVAALVAGAFSRSRLPSERPAD